jgi:hypothetical protein
VPSARRRGVVIFLLVTVVYCASPATQDTDAYLTLPTAWALVHHATLHLDSFHNPAITRYYALATVHGHLVNSFPWLNSLFLVPAVLAFDAGHLMGLCPSALAVIDGPHRTLVDAAQLACASMVTAGAAAVVYAVAYGRFRALAPRRMAGEDAEVGRRRARRLATGVALGFAFATSAWSTASRAMWEHGPSLLFLALAVWSADRVERRVGRPAANAASLGVCLVAAYAARPTNAVAIVVFTLWLAWRHRRVLGWEVGAGLVAGGLWLAVNEATYAKLLPPYNSGDRLSVSHTYLEALAANLVSPSRGLLIFAPVVVLAGVGFWLARPRWSRGLDPALAICVVAHLLVIAGLADHWWAGQSYGPRFTTDVLVYVAVLAVPAVDRLARPATHRRAGQVARAACVVALVWSLFTNASGALARSSWCWNLEPTNVDANPGRVWSWSDPQWATATKRLIDSGSLSQTVVGHCTVPSTE